MLMTLSPLAGCAEDTTSPSGTQSEVEALSFQDQLIASYDRFMTTGGSEYVYSGGDNYILSYQPDGDVAALYNESFDDVIGIEEKQMMTLVLAKTMLDDSATEVTEITDGLELRNPNLGAIAVHFADGYLTSYEALEDTWHGTISYEIDQKVIDMLLTKIANGE